MNVRPFVLLGDAVLKQVRQRLAERVAAWQIQWGLEHIAVDVVCRRAAEEAPVSDAGFWCCSYLVGEGRIWFADGQELSLHLQRQLFPVDRRYESLPAQAGSLAAEGAQRCLRALTDALAGAGAGLAVREEGTAPAIAGHAPGSGAVLVAVKLGEQELLCLLNLEMVQAVGGMPPRRYGEAIPRDRIKKALHAVPVSLSIEVGHAVVNVGSLITLAVGDVILLEKTVDQPLDVLGPGQSTLFRGHLGLVDKTVAIEVVRKDL